jgi:hypothetical protein
MIRSETTTSSPTPRGRSSKGRLDGPDGPAPQHAHELEPLVLDELGGPLFVLDPKPAQYGGDQEARCPCTFEGADGDARESGDAIERSVSANTGQSASGGERHSTTRCKSAVLRRIHSR